MGIAGMLPTTYCLAYLLTAIIGLHSFLKSIQKPCNIKKFKGQTLGVDAYGWLHRGSIAFALDLALDRQTTKYINFAMHRVRMLLYYGVTPYLVFDGGRLPSKDSTEEARAARREESRALGLEHYRTGRAAQAQQELQKAIDVTPYMARVLIEELKKLNIQYIVAPYEADAQLVYLEKEGIINGIISEDSDMLVFGARILVSKLDKHGDCIEISRNNLSACRDASFAGWTDENFRQMCILSGCDYLPNIPGLGLKTSYRNLRKYKTVERVVKMVQYGGQTRVPSNYLEEFRRAELTFLHQRVFCPRARKLVTLNPLPHHIQGELPFIGSDIGSEIAIGIACGELDPITKKPIELKPVYLERARTMYGRRQTFPAPDEKGRNKPISSFFTPKRVPLSELDPNSLTPSPSQQALLVQNSQRSWPARPVAMPGSVSRSASASQPSPRLRRETFLSRAGTLAQPLPVKRQRLCSDAADNQPGMAERSRFFQASADISRMEGSKKGQFKRARKASFGIFSDDSVEKVMCEMHDAMEAAGRSAMGQKTVQAATGTGSVYSDRSERHVATDSRNAASATWDQGTAECSSGTADRNSDDPAIAQKGQGNEEGTKRTPLGLGARFAYVDEVGITKQRVTDKGQQLSRALPQNVLTGSLTCSQRGKQSRRARLTPLQRLQQTALGRSKSMNALNADVVSEGVSQSGYDSDDSKRSSAARQFYQASGSEDLIIPSTDDSEDGSVSKALDLKRFEFCPK
ncbi:predicted protein [Uncinocarpus reesii 1704]|uniref:Uncharacterized protein n=1 Tax=Uncinocarpus reesii (strain UAMH 1704) TaxID=336963 RepID=C4JX22_UNCRE|nr:uncharacterized protein UREG_06195 [Uncinocarpus reesii 1704]EEP81330.1 predicted protein [Uncinocarpus reesii 1704]